MFVRPVKVPARWLFDAPALKNCWKIISPWFLGKIQPQIHWNAKISLQKALWPVEMGKNHLKKRWGSWESRNSPQRALKTVRKTDFTPKYAEKAKISLKKCWKWQKTLAQVKTSSFFNYPGPHKRFWAILSPPFHCQRSSRPSRHSQPPKELSMSENSFSSP